MIPAPPVTVVINGRALPSSQAAVIVAGTVIAPLDPFLTGLADSVRIDAIGGTIQLVRGDATVVVTVGRRQARVGAASVALPIAPYLRDGSPFIPLASVARGLGAGVTYDGRSRTVSIVLLPEPPLQTASPYVAIPGAASPRPFRTDPTATPRPSFTGMPQPRRTPIEVTPSRIPPGR